MLRIQNGLFPVGTQLPPTRTLAEQLGTHRNTVVRAYDELQQAGYINSTVGRGTFVCAYTSAGKWMPSDQMEEETSLSALPWSQLTSHVTASESLDLFDHLQRRPGSDDVINLSRMQPSPDLLPLESFRRCLMHALRKHGRQSLGYAPREGIPQLLRLVGEDLHRRGVPVDPDHILITSGSQQALDIVLRTLVSPGDTFLSDETTYFGAINLLTSIGARIVTVPSDRDGPLLTALESMRQGNVKGFYLMPNGNNPTGASISAERRQLLIDWSHRARVPLIEDDYAADLCLDEELPPPALRALDREVIYIGTFSKRLIPALRIGFLVCPPKLRPHLVAFKHTMDLGNSALLQYALAEFLERGYLRAHLAQIVPAYRQRRDVLEQALRRYLPLGFHWQRPTAGLTLWLSLPAYISPNAAFEQARRNGVLVSPSSLHRAGEGAPGLRLAFCAEPPERLEEGARRLSEALKSFVKPTHETFSATSLGVV